MHNVRLQQTHAVTIETRFGIQRADQREIAIGRDVVHFEKVPTACEQAVQTVGMSVLNKQRTAIRRDQFQLRRVEFVLRKQGVAVSVALAGQ